MGLFSRKPTHQHQWVEKERFYAPGEHPLNFKNANTEADKNFILYIVHGMTTIVQRCETCGDLKTHRIVGHKPA